MSASVYVVGSEESQKGKEFASVAFRQGLDPDLIEKLLHPEDPLRKDRSLLTGMAVVDSTLSLWVERKWISSIFDAFNIGGLVLAVWLVLRFGPQHSPMAIIGPIGVFVGLIAVNQLRKILLDSWWNTSVYSLVASSVDGFQVMEWTRLLVAIRCFIAANPKGLKANLRLIGRGKGRIPIYVWIENIDRMIRELHTRPPESGVSGAGFNQNVKDVNESIGKEFAPSLYNRLEYGIPFRDALFATLAFVSWIFLGPYVNSL